MTLVRWVVVGVGVLAIAVTALALIRSNAAWIRIWDFPRVQIAVVLAAVLISAPFMLALDRWSSGFLAVTAIALAWQIYSIWPYTPLHPIQVKLAARCNADSRLSLVAVNVLMHNRNAEPLLALIAEVNPDLLLLVETDGWWDGELKPLRTSYPSSSPIRRRTPTACTSSPVSR